MIKSIGLRLGVPWYAYDTVTFSGEVTAVEDGLITLKVGGQQQPWRSRHRQRDADDRRDA